MKPLVFSNNKKFDKNVFINELNLIHTSKKNDFTIFKFWRGDAYAEYYKRPVKLYRVLINIRKKKLVFDIYRSMEYNKLSKELKNRKTTEVNLSNIINICMPLASQSELFDFLNS